MTTATLPTTDRPPGLTAETPAGARLVELAERLAEELRGPAADHDRAGTYPHEGIAALLDAGWFAASIPEELGGLGVTSVHDQVVASSRLARGDASVAIGANMHLAVLGNYVRLHALAAERGDERREAAIGAILSVIARDGVVLATAVSEPGQDMTRPATTATPSPGGWRIDGRKVFCTMSPAATVLVVAVTTVGDERYAFAQIPAGTPGIVLHDDWDALGMRASGSQSVSFEGVELPAGAVSGGFPVGESVPYMARNLASGLFHASASLGVAEEADALVRAALRRRGADDPRARMLIAENVVDLATARGVLSRAARLQDAAPLDLDDDEVVGLFAEAQAAKTAVNAAAMRVADRALACSGGAGYMNAHPLSRAVRDARAGMFMHPLGANRAYEWLAKVALGEPPAFH
ncbi:MAG: acyl-CoA/acyl-ACP dehydrogenase [Solirubrobacteraceae bacterium]|nr:acyl-CoA/acyl-ACP dehydrogenase [Solirubrobacteraceae bacterium]